MKPIDTLRAEHGLIRQYLTCLSRALEALERGEAPPTPFFEQAVSFARQFVDKYHHFKEELQLFTLLAQKREGELDAQLAALRSQHENGRNHVAAIDQAKEGCALGRISDTTALTEHLAAFISMLRQHIHREDHGLYQLAESALTSEETERLRLEFERADQKAGSDFMEKSRDRVLKMEALLNECVAAARRTERSPA